MLLIAAMGLIITFTNFRRCRLRSIVADEQTLKGTTMTIKTIDEHAYEIVTEEGTFAACKDTLAKFDVTRHEHGVAACGCCFTGNCCDDTDCEHNHTEECEGKACLHACHENREGHECAFCHLAFDTNEKCHDEILADLKELKAELAA